ncbi:hypothetical protein PWG71_24200 [Nocardiopsis sp. N85]|uniref:hypothetical protein n=1 Tax=Nocardiopsis sp. N85 TaxID=3029400 RepID=UPI00237F6DB2|nr:hypothetical protein [Nocardiopsis sp. N85]MDE3724505.1 hypothetical protein [Nocardiopsis sp. N85]
MVDRIQTPDTRPMSAPELLVLASVVVGQLSGDYPELMVKVDHHDGPHVDLWLCPSRSTVKERRQLVTDISRTFDAPVNGWETPVASVYARDWNGTGVRVSCLCKIADDLTEE